MCGLGKVEGRNTDDRISWLATGDELAQWVQSGQARPGLNGWMADAQVGFTGG